MNKQKLLEQQQQQQQAKLYKQKITIWFIVLVGWLVDYLFIYLFLYS